MENLSALLFKFNFWFLSCLLFSKFKSPSLCECSFRKLERKRLIGEQKLQPNGRFLKKVSEKQKKLGLSPKRPERSQFRKPKPTTSRSVMRNKPRHKEKVAKKQLLLLSCQISPLFWHRKDVK
jgi:hypothetical protein